MRIRTKICTTDQACLHTTLSFYLHLLHVSDDKVCFQHAAFSNLNIQNGHYLRPPPYHKHYFDSLDVVFLVTQLFSIPPSDPRLILGGPPINPVVPATLTPADTTVLVLSSVVPPSVVHVSMATLVPCARSHHRRAETSPASTMGSVNLSVSLDLTSVIVSGDFMEIDASSAVVRQMICLEWCLFNPGMLQYSRLSSAPYELYLLIVQVKHDLTLTFLHVATDKTQDSILWDRTHDSETISTWMKNHKQVCLVSLRKSWSYKLK